MIGLKNIASYIPENSIENIYLKDKFQFDEEFLLNKIGVEKRSMKNQNEKTSHLCYQAFKNLIKKENISTSNIDLIIVVTQNPDYPIPHTSAILHKLLNLPESCAAFDISLGCSGFVYALSVTESFLKNHSLKKALLFTCDPYSDIINKNDKNTVLLFGDAATCAYINDEPLLISGKYSFGTLGDKYHELMIKDGYLCMNGSAIVKFAAKTIPQDVNRVLALNHLNTNDIDYFLFHQGSKFIIDIIRKNLNLPEDKVPFDIINYGNTVSSSIPILLEKYLHKKNYQKLLISGFGVGLSWASAILTKTETLEEFK